METSDFNESEKILDLNPDHLILEKPVESLTDLEVRELLGQVIEKMNYTLDQVNHIYEELIKVNERTNELKSGQIVITEEQAELVDTSVFIMDSIEKVAALINP